MNNVLRDRDIVLFLGAGFSVDADYPGITGFGSFAMQEGRRLSKHAKQGNEFRYAGPMLAESFAVFQEFQKYCLGPELMGKQDVENMESIFAIAEVLKESGLKEIGLRGSKYQIKELIAHIQLTLWKIYHRCSLVAKTRYNDKDRNMTWEQLQKNKREIYEPFFKLILDDDLSRRLSIITTNYDLVIESMFNAFNSRCIYPILNNEQKKSLIAGMRTEEDMNSSDSRYVEYFYKMSGDTIKTKTDSLELDPKFKDSPILCKLHGSINYFYDPREDNGEKIYISDDLGDKQDIGKSGNWNNRPSILALDAIWNLHNKYGRSFMPAIIPPTYSKLTGQRWLTDIWNAAIHLLSNAKQIIFIGYSFPETDGFMKAMIQGAMAERMTGNLPEIHVVVKDDKGEVIPRYKKLFGEDKIKESPMKFSDAVKNRLIEDWIKSSSS
jgi:hypothetical protein